MTTEEIHERLQSLDDLSSASDLIPILEHMNNKIAELEKRLIQTDIAASRTANIASCLANGIQPD